MGAGNPLIRSYDEDLYCPNTYFIDFTDFYSNEERIETVKCHFDANDRIEDYHQLNNEEIDNEFMRLIEDDVESFQNDFFFNLPEPYENWFHKPNEDERYIEELSAMFHGAGIVLAENDDCLVLTTSEAEPHHYPIGLVPNFKYEDLVEDWYQENKHKEDWYDARGLNFDRRCCEQAKIIYQKKLDKWLETYEPFMKWFHSIHKEGMQVRSGAWCSTYLSNAGNNYKFL